MAPCSNRPPSNRSRPATAGQPHRVAAWIVGFGLAIGAVGNADAVGHVGTAGAHAATIDLLAPPALDRLRVLTLNAEHQLSHDRWRAWQAWCEPRGWSDTRTAEARPDGIAYCNALDGSNGRGSRLFAPLRDDAAWQDKTRQLAEALRQAAPDLILLQEVGDRAAVAAIVGPAHQIAVSTAAGSHQQVAIAWPASLARHLVGPPEIVASLAVSGPDGRRTRPGIAVRLRLAEDRTLAVINLHLKAGCRQGRMTEGPSQRPERRYRRAADCAVLQRQVVALETWIDAEIDRGHAVLVAGDFNRDLRRERQTALPARQDGSDPATATHPSRIVSLLAELDDGVPGHLRLAPSGHYRRLADCHRHIDAFLLDNRLAGWLSPNPPLRTVVQPWPAPISLDRIRPSDHCPHWLDLHFRPSASGILRDEGRPPGFPARSRLLAPARPARPDNASPTPAASMPPSPR